MIAWAWHAGACGAGEGLNWLLVLKTQALGAGLFPVMEREPEGNAGIEEWSVGRPIEGSDDNCSCNHCGE